MKHGPDPGDPKYEAARALLASELIKLGLKDKARLLMSGELYEIEPWIAMQIIGRLACRSGFDLLAWFALGRWRVCHSRRSGRSW